MSGEWVAPAIVVGLSFSTGAWVGYQTRKLVVRFKEWRSNRTNRRDIVVEEARVEHGFPQVKEIGARPALIPLMRSTAKQGVVAIPIINPDRDDVVAALVGAGFKKTEATAAADACESWDRIHGVERWVAAALQRTHLQR